MKEKEDSLKEYLKDSIPFYITVIIAIIGIVSYTLLHSTMIVMLSLVPFIIYGIIDLKGTRIF